MKKRLTMRDCVMSSVTRNEMDAVIRAQELLGFTRLTPRMYAVRREAFLAHVCGVVHVVIPTFSPYVFYQKHLGMQGGSYVTHDELVEDDWARGVIDDALALFIP